MFRQVSCLSWKWRRRSTVRITERTLKKTTLEVPRRGKRSLS